MGTISRITTDMLYDKIHAAAERAAPVKVHEFEDEVNVKIVLELGEHSWFKTQPKY